MTTANIRRVALIGVGIMGSGMAAEWAAAGHDVTLFARDEERVARGKERVAAALRTLDFKGGLDAFLIKASDEELSLRARRIKRQLKAKIAEKAA